MVKICKNCGHKKGEHKFYKIRNNIYEEDKEYCCCHHKTEDGNICGCTNFVQKENVPAKGQANAGDFQNTSEDKG